MNKILSLLQSISFKHLAMLTTAVTIVVGCFDYWIGYEISTTIFYFLPLMIAAWFGSKRLGWFIAVLSATLWMISDIGAGDAYSNNVILVWNTFMRFCIFIIIVNLLSSFRAVLHKEQIAADTDPLTGAYNTRGFKDLLQNEYNRSIRYNRIFSVALLDADNFKYVNDHYGHATGDKVLCCITEVLNKSLRTTDILARLGGDEFVILFPETTYTMVNLAFVHIHELLNNAMKQNNWPVTFSIGCVTFDSLPDSVDAIIAIADETMYGVKKNLKNSIAFTKWARSV